MAETVKSQMEDLSLSKDKVNKTEGMASNSDLTTEGKNSKQIKCHRCPSIILAIGSASLVTHKVIFYLCKTQTHYYYIK